MRERLLTLLWLTCAGCEDVDLERMIVQPSYKPYEASDLFENGMAMRRAPPGTIPRGRLVGPPSLLSGVAEGRFLESIPIPIGRPEVMEGRRRFDIHCAPCHGVAGDGRSPVAADMKLRPPPSLVAPPISDYPPGRIFHAATLGYGLMPSYADELTVQERWTVVSYVAVLELRQGVPLGDLPPELRAEADKWLP